jgi:hypothetical protein
LLGAEIFVLAALLVMASSIRILARVRSLNVHSTADGSNDELSGLADG